MQIPVASPAISHPDASSEQNERGTRPVRDKKQAVKQSNAQNNQEKKDRTVRYNQIESSLPEERRSRH